MSAETALMVAVPQLSARVLAQAWAGQAAAQVYLCRLAPQRPQRAAE